MTLPETALRLQQTVGNSATEALLAPDLVPGQREQRPLVASAHIPPGQVNRNGDPEQGRWDAPTGVVAETNREAGLQVLFIVDELGSIQRELDDGELEELDAAHDEGMAYMRHFAANTEGQLSARYAEQLTAWSEEAERAGERGLRLAREPAEDLLENLRDAPTVEELPDERAMELHVAFTQGSEDRLGDIRSVIDTIRDYNSKVQDLTSKAADALSGVREAKTISQVNSAAGHVGGYLDKISNVVGAARGFATLAELDNQSPDDMQNAIGQVEAQLEGIDAAMAFLPAVPVLGDLWDSYYLPAAKRCLSLLRVIATQEARRWRTAFRVQSQNWSRGQPPRIPDNLLEFFPGGRPMFRFIWNVLCDQQVQPTRHVREYFLDHEELFEAGTGSDIETERHGFLWLKERILTDLWGYARRNRHALWAMLYADLPYPAGVG